MMRLPWYRLPVRVPLWFALVALAGWGIVMWRGASAAQRGMSCVPSRNPYVADSVMGLRWTCQPLQ